MNERPTVPVRDSATSPGVLPGLFLKKVRHLAAGSDEADPSGWVNAWPDALAFVGGLALAWFNQWETKDLVWSLWLSSLLVGYAMIVWTIFGSTIGILWGNRFKLQGERAAPVIIGGGALLVGGVFMLAFFTVHFGGFHFVHSVFLNGFFPINDAKGFPGLAVYAEVFRSYWVFVVLAAISERKAFKAPNLAEPIKDDLSVTAKAIERRKRRNAGFGGGNMMAPYKNVIRLHLLIFFFAFAHFAKLDNFLVYAVVYAVYFFPWRLLGRRATEAA